MNTETADSTASALPPLPYPYEGPAQALAGPAFGPLFKALAWAMSLGLVAWTWRLGIDWRSSHGAWVAVACAMLVCIAWFIQTSRTQIDAQGIEQTWMWRRQVALRELALLKVMRVPGLEFLIAPRIYARTLSGRFHFFYCHDPRVLEEFRRIAVALRDHALRP